MRLSWNEIRARASAFAREWADAIYEKGELDRAVDRLYRRARFTSERERVEYLFALYERLQAPLTAKAAGKGRRRPRTRGVRGRKST